MEIMGRNAGWLTGATALAKTEDCDGPDLIYLPEVPFDMERIPKEGKRTSERKNRLLSLLFQRGLSWRTDSYVCELGQCRRLCGRLSDTSSFREPLPILRISWRQNVAARQGQWSLSTLQRSASHMASRVDIDEAFMVGGAAVKAADEGDTGKMIVIDRVSDDPYMSATGIYDVHRIANEEKLVPREWMNREANYVTKDFVDYIKPLIQGDYQPIMVNGLPRHLGFEDEKEIRYRFCEKVLYRRKISPDGGPG